ncbi:MAG: hypothetical protein JSR36_11180 [Proteobacteria bacterium]|nr:hypothetical protein [Pseudomonadota bacterium]
MANRRILMRLPSPLAALCALAVLAACASTAPRQDPESVRARYASYAGEPLDRITWLGRFDSWESLGNNQLLIFTTPRDAYLLSITPPCTDLPFAQVIGVTATASTITARLDSIIVKGWRCQIAEIRKVDYARMRADMRQEAEAAKAAGKPPH